MITFERLRYITHLVCEADVHHSSKLSVCKMLRYMEVFFCFKLVNGPTLDLFGLVEFAHTFQEERVHLFRLFRTLQGKMA